MHWIGIGGSKFHDWKHRFGKVNEHNARIPRDHWLTDAEQRVIVDFHAQYPLEGYRRLTFMMIDRDIVACSPTSVYRVLQRAGLLCRWTQPTRKGTGFVQPLTPHEHWHTDFSYVNIGGVFYFLCAIIDGASRYVVHWEIRPTMKETDAEIVLQRAREKFPTARPRLITDNGSQFVAQEFKTYVRLASMTHVRTSPGYPQSNGKIERFYRTIKTECIRPQTPLSLEDANRVVAKYVQHYNEIRLHGAIGYVTPADKLNGREKEIHAARDRKLQAAREQRQHARQKARAATTCPTVAVALP